MPTTSLQSATLDGSYEVLHFIVQKSIRPLVKGSQITANFADGNLGGNATINTYKATYTTNKEQPPSQITVNPNIIMSKIGGEPELLQQEGMYIDGLTSASGISYTDDGITLTSDNGQKGVAFRRL